MKGGTVQINWHETKPVLTLDFHPLSATLATGGADFDIKLWSINSAEAQKKLPGVTYLNSLSYHSSAVNVIRFSSSGELLASGADGGDLIIWKLHPTDTGQTWKVLKMLRSHHKDVLDLQWSPDAAFIISGSVDNSCIIWDVNKGTNLQILDAHAHYVQGVAWDPLGKYIASLSSDRTCRIYMNRPKKSKGSDRINYVCQQIISKAEYPLLGNSKSTNYHLFHDETLPSFFRRLAWSPDGSFLLVPADGRARVDALAVRGLSFYMKLGSYKVTSGSESINAAYIFSRKDLSRPAIQLPCASKAVVAVRFCPINFSLRGINSAGLFKLPYRIIFAMATLNSLYIYDTENNPPIAIMAGLHYASITDIAWSPDAHYLALSSQDGYCTLVEFENNELGSPISLSGEKKVSSTDNKKSLQTADSMVIEATRNVGSFEAESSKTEAESSKTEAEAKVDDMVIEGTSNVAVVAESRKTEAEEKGDDMVIEEPSNCGRVIGESRKMEANGKDDMVIDATGNAGAVVTDNSKNKAEDKAEKQPLSSDTMKSEGKGMAENQHSSLVNVRKEAEEKAEKLQPSSDGIKSEAEAEKRKPSLDNLKREAEEKVACSSKGMPMSNKQGKKRITPIAIDP